MSETQIIEEIQSAWRELEIPVEDRFRMLAMESSEEAVNCLCGKGIEEVDTDEVGFEALSLMWLPPDAAAYYLGVYLCEILRVCGNAGNIDAIWGVVARQNVFTLLDTDSRAREMTGALSERCKKALCLAIEVISLCHRKCYFNQTQVHELKVKVTELLPKEMEYARNELNSGEVSRKPEE